MNLAFREVLKFGDHRIIEHRGYLVNEELQSIFLINKDILT